jgi:hypothetical protein
MSKTPLRKSLNNVFYGGVATSAMDTLATGPFLIAYALMFGAGNIAIGFLGAIGFIGNLMHLLSAYLIAKGKTPKQISVLFSIISRPFYLIAALLAFWAGSSWTLVLLIGCFSATYMIGSVAGGAWLPWMKALVPTNLMGRFFSHRFKWMMITKIICYGGGATLIWYFEEYKADKTIFAYSILLGIAFIIGLYGVFTLTQVENKCISYQKTDSFFKKTIQTLKNKPFKKLLIFLGSLNFSINFITPFITVLMLKVLGFSTPVVVALTVISQFTHAFSVKTWGKLADQKNCFKILQKSIPLFMVCIMLFIGCLFIQNQHIIFGLLVDIHILLGISQSAITLGMNNISLLHIPTQDASIYLSVNSVFKSFMAAIASVIAGIILDGLLWGTNTFCTFEQNATTIGWSIFFLLSLISCLITFLLLKRVQVCSKK